ncbi:MAG: peptidoglycan D,D-transpeptidase FtsI family protein [Lachnospiraceae bacterium]
MLFKELFEIIREKMYEIVTSRLFWASVFFVVLFGVLVGRLFYLQVIRGEEYYEKYVDITLTEVENSAPRGNIYDRNGKLLAWNEITYSVTIRDTGKYSDSNSNYTLNPMILRLVELLEEYGQEIKTFIPVIINEDGEYEFSGSTASVRLFIRDMYGKEKIALEAEKGNDIYSYDAETVMEYARETIYRFARWRDKDEETVNSLSKEHELKILNIRYALTGYSYRKYQSVTICNDISDELSAAIMENSYNIDGVEVSQESTRVYIDNPAFSHILGYTGIIRDQEECDEFNAKAVEEGYIEEGETMYALGDYVGRTGIERAMDLELQGKKGKTTMYLNNVGQILETVSVVEAVVGNDVYLSLDADMQSVAYAALETSIADRLVERVYYGNNEIYYQLINNNVIDTNAFADEDASDLEKDILNRFYTFRSERIDMIVDVLQDKNGENLEDLPEEMQEYISYIFDELSNENVIYTSDIDRDSAEYQSWKEEEIGVYQYLYFLICNGYIDTSLFNNETKYISGEEMYGLFVDYIVNFLEDKGFNKILYKYMIETGAVSSNEICLILFEQEILDYSEVDVEQLKKNNPEDAYRFIIQKVKNHEITPAQLAMDPCSGACVVTDPNTGEILAMASYPGYDLNKLSGTIDAAYWKKLTEDLSQPMYNNATQNSIAPGSTFKVITSIAAVDGGYVTESEQIECTGIYDLTGQKCWYYTEHGIGHGNMDTRLAIANSCNIYFYEMGYRFSLENGKMNEEKGLEVLRNYASQFGLNEKTGIELSETAPRISDELPISSAIGQGTNSFTAIQLSRYLSALASKGNVYQYTLISKVENSKGEVLQEYEPNIINHVDLSEELWNIVYDGMVEVARSGSIAGMFNDIEETIAGKTGSAQQDLSRPNHGWFISFAPAENPEIAIDACVNFGNGSISADYVVKGVYYYYFGYKTYEEITTTVPEMVDYNSEIRLPEEEVVND